MDQSFVIQINLYYILIPVISIFVLGLLLYGIYAIGQIPNIPEKLPEKNTENGELVLYNLKHNNLNWQTINVNTTASNMPDTLQYGNFKIILFSSKFEHKMLTSYPYNCAVTCIINDRNVDLNRKDNVDIFNLALPILQRLYKEKKDAEAKALAKKNDVTQSLKDFKAANTPKTNYASSSSNAYQVAANKFYDTYQKSFYDSAFYKSYSDPLFVWDSISTSNPYLENSFKYKGKFVEPQLQIKPSQEVKENVVKP